MSQKPTQTRNAFTLIEILVVVVIMSLLVAILFPVFARARASARRSSCQSNLKQLGLGIMQYTQDYDEQMPPGRPSGVPAPNPPRFSGAGWGGTVYPYIKNAQVFTCPDDVGQPRQWGTDWYTNISYAINTNLCGSTNHVGPHTVRTLSAMNAPARTVLLSEVQIPDNNWRTKVSDPLERDSISRSPSGNGRWLSNDGPDNACPSCDLAVGQIKYVTGWLGGLGNSTFESWQRPDGSQVGAQTGVHLEGANYAFADGHVKWLKGDSVSPGFGATNPSDDQMGWRAAGTQNGRFAATFSGI